MNLTAAVADRQTGEGESTGVALKLHKVERSDELVAKEALVRSSRAASAAPISTASTKNRVPPPAALGHDRTGIVERVGAMANTIKPGDHVIMATSRSWCSNRFVRRGSV